MSISREEREPHALSGHVVADEGDILRMVVADGAALMRGSLLYVSRHGLFELSEPFDGAAGAELTLKAWPSR